MNTYEEDGSTACPTIIVPGGADHEVATARLQWESFDVSQCECYRNADKERILRVISLFPGGIAIFNEYVKTIAQNYWPQNEVLHCTGVASDP